MLAFIAPTASAESNSVTFEKPPASLEQWYKPANKRNVWHHNMFKLRRELQAVKEYRAEKDQILTEKWALKFVEHYRKIGDMVPEWKEDLELEWADKLEQAAKKGDNKVIGTALSKIKTSCKGCHDDFRAQVAAVHRAPDFSKIQLTFNDKKISYLKFMKILMRDINRIKISLDDKNKDRALLALKESKKGLTTLRSSCKDCHKDDEAKDYYLGEKITGLLDKLEISIKKGEKSGRIIGEFAVQACARCHGSHRISYDLKHEIE